MKARDLLRAVEHYAKSSPEEMLKQLPDDKFRQVFLASALLFKQMKAEAVRRGVWGEMKGKKP